ncbi:hypothetical protein CDAR_259341 [Caerostris darwini]|uniref:Uncharacterized protein n=1 Tax=Caerostris darwini TaxID=1538125 RepID=A0AAV4VJA6_9ARAC|nr:hypothetical protein CDAR_259341 [Caerostris darwini]
MPSVLFGNDQLEADEELSTGGNVWHNLSLQITGFRTFHNSQRKEERQLCEILQLPSRASASSAQPLISAPRLYNFPWSYSGAMLQSSYADEF